MPATSECPVIRLSDHLPSGSTTTPADEPPIDEAPARMGTRDESMGEGGPPRPAAVSSQSGGLPSNGQHQRVEVLFEYANSLGLRPQVNIESGIIQGVKVLGPSSRNGRSYRTAAMAAAVPLYEGVKVNVNHPKGGAASPRDYQDRLGCLRNVRADDGGLFGDLHFNPHHPVAAQLAWDAQWSPENVGLSHNVQARTSRQDGQTVVEQILRVNSVDLVADPATTHGLFESAGEPSSSLQSSEAGPSDAALSEARKQLAEKRRRVEALLREARLPSEAGGAAFVEQLCSLDDDVAQALIEERAQVYRSFTGARGKPKSKGPAPEAADHVGDVRRWARLIT